MSTTSTLFTPLSAVVGGIFIGLAAAVLLIANGDVMGASGITSSAVLQPRTTWNDNAWKLVFNASFIVASILYTQLRPSAIVDSGATHSLSVVGWILAGLLVGFGSKLGNGCTSGHGVCGMARFSKRSIVALAVFMLVAFGTATIVSQKFFQESGLSFLFLDKPTASSISVIGQVIFDTLLVGVALCSVLSKPSMKMIGAAIAGAVFAVGLAVSKMVLPSKVIGFLDLSGFSDGTYDPSLILVMGAAIAVSLMSYQYKKHRCEIPLCAKEFNVPTNTIVDARLLIGAVVFGLGWGFGGVCPGPALFLAGNGVSTILFMWMPSYLAGSFLASLCKPKELCCRNPDVMRDVESAQDDTQEQAEIAGYPDIIDQAAGDGSLKPEKANDVIGESQKSTMELTVVDDGEFGA